MVTRGRRLTPATLRAGAANAARPERLATRLEASAILIEVWGGVGASRGIVRLEQRQVECLMQAGSWRKDTLVKCSLHHMPAEVITLCVVSS